MKHFISEEKRETIVGALALLGLFVLLGFAHMYKKQDSAVGEDFRLYAYFKKADGLLDGAVVRLGGIPVGRVVHQELTGAYTVKLEMSLDHPIDLSTDTIAAIETDGIIGSKHLELIPGGEEESLKNGDTMQYVQDVVLLDDLINQFVSYMNSKTGTSPAEKTAEQDLLSAEMDAFDEEEEE